MSTLNALNKRYRILVSMLSFLAMGVANAQPEKVVVTRVLDGDTVVVAGRADNIRLANIDAPESSSRGKVGQPYSASAAKYLEKLVLGSDRITMECFDRDTRYGRDVCEFFKNGHSVNRQMVATGMAWANTSARGRYLRDPFLPVLQDQARNARLGLWAADSSKSPATPPWEWRDVCWRQGICLVPSQP